MGYEDVIASHRASLDRLIDRVAVDRLRRLYDSAQAELEAKLARLVGAGRGETMTAHQQRILLLQVHDAQTRLAGAMAGELTEAGMQARAEAIRQLTASVAQLDDEFGGAAIQLPVEQAGVFSDILQRGKPSLLAAHETSMARYGAHVVGQMQDALGLSVASGETGHETIQRVMGAADLAWYQAERIVRTETAFASNSAAADVIAETPGLWARWVEHVGDDGAPLDDRVAVDSLAMHGQVAHPGGLFTMPPTSPDGQEVQRTLVGRVWAHPPNRPNDRAVLAPWRARWGTPGWQWVGGDRVPVIDAPKPDRDNGRVPEVRGPGPAPLPVTANEDGDEIPVEVGPVVDLVAEGNEAALVAMRDEYHSHAQAEFDRTQANVDRWRQKRAETEAGNPAHGDLSSVIRKLEGAEAEALYTQYHLTQAADRAAAQEARVRPLLVPAKAEEIADAAEQARVSGHLAAEQQRAVRQLFNDQLTPDGMINRDVNYDESHKISFEDLKGAAGAYHYGGTGEIRVDEKLRPDVSAALQYASDPQKHQPTAGIIRAMNILVHETAHGFSRLGPQAYVGVAAKIEEVTTEVVARKKVRAMFPGEVLHPAATHFAIDGGLPSETKPVGGAYGGEIFHVLGHIQAAGKMAWTEAVDALETASVKIKGPGKIIHDGDDFVRAFADSFDGLKPKQREVLRKKLMADKRGWMG